MWPLINDLSWLPNPLVSRSYQVRSPRLRRTLDDDLVLSVLQCLTGLHPLCPPASATLHSSGMLKRLFLPLNSLPFPARPPSPSSLISNLPLSCFATFFFFKLGCGAHASVTDCLDMADMELMNIFIVGGNAVSAFLSWRLQATNACDVTLVWKSGFEHVAQYGISFK